tara:strand:- start:199 stop:330 length:132 start_codon:yes stop_codon:yes gene_type:complete
MSNRGEVQKQKLYYTREITDTLLSYIKGEEEEKKLVKRRRLST